MSRRKGRTTVFRQNIPAVNIITQAESQAVAQVEAQNATENAFANMSGIVFAYAGTIPPFGWLICDGSTVSRTIYADLFARIGTAHGSGDGVTTFRLPDYRGRFLRGVDSGSGRDPDVVARTAMNSGGNTQGNIGSVQNQDFQAHQHAFQFTDMGGDSTNGNRVDQSAGGATVSAVFVTAFTGGNETRPVNAYVNYIIKT